MKIICKCATIRKYTNVLKLTAKVISLHGQKLELHFSNKKPQVKLVTLANCLQIVNITKNRLQAINWGCFIL